ncbi:unnamed protein product [Coregonus sp. 'balchen']|nr:unnamed protein product [Coregonus sp. 'balchen']
MSDSNCQCAALQFYCTAGNGMEPFLIQEVKTKLAAKDVDHIPGKVFFTTTFGIKQVRELKSAERLFLLLKRHSPLSAHTVKTPSGIQSRLMGDGSDWTRAVLSWRRLQRDLMMRSNCTLSVSLPGRKRKREEEEEKESGVEGSTCNGPNGTQKLGLEGERKELGLSKDHISSTEDSGSGNCVAGDKVEEDRIEGSCDGKTSTVSFRVSCRCSGALSRRFSPQDLSRIIGTAASRQLGWRVDLRKPDLEVNVYISDDHCVLGIPLLRLPGSCVIDPMCGVGTILLEAAHEYQDAFFLGLDIDESQLVKACQNVEFAKFGDRVQLLQSSSKDIPLPSCSVDAVVCDVPFGKKFGTKTDMAASLPVIVREMERVLRVGGTLVLLLSPQLSCLLKKSITPRPVPLHTQGEETEVGLVCDVDPFLTPSPFPSLQSLGYHRVSLGAIDALIHKYVKILTATTTLGGPD